MSPKTISTFTSAPPMRPFASDTTTPACATLVERLRSLGAHRRRPRSHRAATSSPLAADPGRSRACPSPSSIPGRSVTSAAPPVRCPRPSRLYARRIALFAEAVRLHPRPLLDVHAHALRVPSRQPPPARRHARAELIRRACCAIAGLQDSRTYSNSMGWPLMPRGGGAIQLANWPGSITGLHQAAHVGLVLGGGQPLALARVPLRLAEHPAVGRDLHLGEGADGAMEAPVGQRAARSRSRAS